jgi:ribonuclease D
MASVAATNVAQYFVTTVEALDEVVAALQHHDAFAVDVEFSPKSFHGFVCTVQISAPGMDVLIDALQPQVRAVLGSRLGPLFIDSRKLKVLHAATNDVRWLHANFGLFIVNLFDTAAAARSLAFPSTSLGTLYHSVLSVEQSRKQEMQHADWSKRPLPPDMVAYALSDTHSLLLLAHKLMEMVVARESNPAAANRAVLSVLQRAQEVVLLRFDLSARETFDPAVHLGFALRKMHRQTDFTIPPLPAAQGSSTAVVAAPSAIQPTVLLGVAVGATDAVTADLFVAMCRWRHSEALRKDRNPEEVSSDRLLAICKMAAKLLSYAAQPQRVNLCHTLLEGERTYLSLLCSELLPTSLHEAACEQLMVHIETYPDALNAKAAALRLEDILIAGNEERKTASAPASASATTSVSAADKALNASGMRDAIKSQRARNIFMPRATPLYSNIELVSPDGVVMARVDRKRAQWYLDAGAATVLSGAAQHIDAQGQIRERTVDDGSDALRIQLRTQPRGLGHAGDVFHLAPRKNECAVCGVNWADSDGKLLRCYVIPRSYRCHFPLAAKSYTSHDVLLTCAICHRQADVAGGALSRRIFRELNLSAKSASVAAAATAAEATTVTEASSETMTDIATPSAAVVRNMAELTRDLQASRRTANALARSPLSLPEERRADLVADIGRYAYLVPFIREAQEQAQQEYAAKRKRKAQAKQQELQVQQEPQEEEVSVEADAAEAADAAPDSSAARRRRRVSVSSMMTKITPAAEATFRQAWSSWPDTNSKSIDADGVLLLATAHVQTLGQRIWRVMKQQQRQPKNRDEDDELGAEVEDDDDEEEDQFDLSTEVMRAVLFGTPAWAVASRYYPKPDEASPSSTSPAPAAAASTNNPFGTVSGLPLECENRIVAFVQRWRADFVRVLNPKALPVGWAVDYRVFMSGHRKQGAEPALVLQALEHFREAS